MIMYRDSNLKTIRTRTSHSLPSVSHILCHMGRYALLVTGLLMLGFVTGCTTTTEQPIPEPEVSVSTEPVLDTAPLANVSKKDIRFAQIALKQLDFDIGKVDGIWGQRSEKALKNFEEQYQVVSAGGKLSEANLYALSQVTDVSQSDLEPRPAKTSEESKWEVDRESSNIASKLNSQDASLDEAPELILLDKPYPMMEKPNPFSQMVAVLQPGAGVYVISSDSGGWYEIESLDKQRGFIREP